MFDENLVVHECIDCGAHSPQISEGDTFLSTKYGWRLTRHANDRGELSFEWRCPTCWQRFKSSKLPGVDRDEEIPSSRLQPRGERPETRANDVGRYVMVAERPPRSRGR